MTLEITSRNTLDPTVVAGEFASFVDSLNIAAASGKQFVIAAEVRGDEETHVALETRNITRVRDLGSIGAFIGR